MVDGPERHDREFESSGKLEVGHISFDESDSIARAAGQCICLGTASCEHLLGFIESGHGTPGLGGGNEHTASTAAQFERLSSLPAEIDIEAYVSPRVVQRNVVVQFWKFRMSVVAGFRGHSSLWPTHSRRSPGKAQFVVRPSRHRALNGVPASTVKPVWARSSFAAGR